MADSPRPSSSLFARVPLFWQLQLAGWSGVMVLSLPLKQLVYGSMQAALLITAYQLPLSLALTWLLRLLFRRLRLPERTPGMSVGLVLTGCAAIAALDVLVSLPVNHL